MLVFKNYLPTLLSEYIVQEDSYKDINGKGFIVRYLEIFGEELDDELYGKIEEFLVNLNPLTADVKFLDYFAVQLGDIERFIDDDYDYRRFLSYLVSIYKIKGTKKSYLALLRSLGLETTVTEIPSSAIAYDDPTVFYDDTEAFYDINCQPCSDYELVITGDGPITGDLYRKIIALVTLIEPINAKLITVIYNGVPVTGVFIEVIIDDNGDLIYTNDADPGLILTLVNGDLIIDGPNAALYYLENGDLYFVL